MDGVAGLAGWRRGLFSVESITDVVVFILELRIASVLVAIFAFFAVYDLLRHSSQEWNVNMSSIVPDTTALT